MCMSFNCKFLLIELTANNMLYQIIIPNKNSKLSISYVAKQSASLFILGSSLVCANCYKASLICGSWNFIALTLSMRLSQCICDNDLRVKPNTLSCKFFHLFVKEEKNVYMRCITQKKKKMIQLLENNWSYHIVQG